MRALFALAMYVIMIGEALAGPYQDGLGAFSRGDFVTALRLLRPSAGICQPMVTPQEQLQAMRSELHQIHGRILALSAEANGLRRAARELQLLNEVLATIDWAVEVYFAVIRLQRTLGALAAITDVP